MTAGADVRDQLGRWWRLLDDEFDLKENMVKSDVKTGRSRPGSTIDEYISYKNADHLNLSLVGYQMGRAKPLFWEVLLRDTTRNANQKVLYSSDYAFASAPTAFADFRSRLAGLGVRRRRYS